MEKQILKYRKGTLHTTNNTMFSHIRLHYPEYFEFHSTISKKKPKIAQFRCIKDLEVEIEKLKPEK